MMHYDMKSRSQRLVIGSVRPVIHTKASVINSLNPTYWIGP